jgi:hypothetical protein
MLIGCYTITHDKWYILIVVVVAVAVAVSSAAAVIDIG